MEWSNKQITSWRSLHQTYTEDASQVSIDKDVDAQRSRAVPEMVQCLNSFLDGDLTLRAFNAVFQQKTQNAWSAFHLKGMSGGLFLNKLIKYVPNEETFAHLLRMILRAPEEERDGQRKMQAFVRFLKGLIASQQVTQTQLQPARVPFFLSAWWHVQSLEQWPIFYADVRSVLAAKGNSRETIQDPGAVYFAFRSGFISLANTLGLSSWELEHICRWAASRDLNAGAIGKKQLSADTRRDSARASPHRQRCMLAIQAKAQQAKTTVTESNGLRSAQKEPMISCRTHLQWLLARIGHKVGCRVWIAASDHSKVCQNERLGDLSLSVLPILPDSAFQGIVSRIDVLWLLGNDVIAAYEIEQAHTDVSISLLRLYDLGALFPDREVQLCVVAPHDRFEKVQFELSRPTFHENDVRKPCSLISEELLLQQKEHILRWASSPSVIQNLTGNIDGFFPSSKEQK